MDIRTMQLEICRECTDYEICRFIGLMVLLRDLKEEKFYGSLHITFKNGELSGVRKKEIIDFIRK